MNNCYAFIGGDVGPWRVISMTPLRGADLHRPHRLNVVALDQLDHTQPTNWVLRGLISNLRCATRHEVTALKARQEGLNRPAATRAALIPIKKSSTWWNLAQDERRTIFEDLSRHTAVGLEYLPGVARQLYHCRDIGEPFDFLTWFEYAPENAAIFDELVARLRATREWTYVEREIDIRLERG
jgi:Chlorite dismutase